MFLQVTLRITLKQKMSLLSSNRKKALRSGSAPAVVRYAAWWRSPRRSLPQKADLPRGQVQQSQANILLNLRTYRYSISPHPPKTLAHHHLQIPETKAVTGGRGQQRETLLAGRCQWDVQAGPHERRPARQ